ncbi:MAG: hyi 2 [Planctomycetota bacterium]|nr:hyi 2 [Planctomycetota bacterium]
MGGHQGNSPKPNRRALFRGAAGVSLVGLAAFGREAKSEEGRVVKNGRIKQSLVHWCYSPFWEIAPMCKVAKSLGCVSIEILDPKHFPVLKEHGLDCAIGQIDMSPDPPFLKGFNNPTHHDRVIKATRDSIDACAAFGCKRVISFTGMRDGIPDDQGATNCVDGFKKVIGHAEKKGVTLCLEMLNSRVSDHPMKGHPGYQGDHTDYCVDIIQRVGSPNLKLLFDVYHVQIMDGDVIRRIRQHKDYIGHVHTAGNPGRAELDDTQEIQYPPIMKALLEIGYQGYVGQEFIPTRDPLEGLKQAVALCDV